ncbi:MAG TPA: hypothetical protein VHB20_16240 [Verrucomicrobiae bacterium]|jgi:hypothetical protein|nr:hypothetical protein [Verrucomicrobiae bacterium]
METGVAGWPEAERREAPPASGLPCLSVTTASEDEFRPVPGPRKKLAEALTKNIEWMAAIFGRERIGFLTLTLGDLDAGGRYRNLRDRKEAQRRFHSPLTNEISKRYVCGVTVTERHRNGGIHFHLVVACKDDIRGSIDFAACFPAKDAKGKPSCKPNYATATEVLKREWAYWRRTSKLYGFGRHQLQPMRENGTALGRYLGEYLRKDWESRLPEDKGARCVRYFGHWSADPQRKGECKATPPHKGRFGWMTPRARAWREMVKQTVIVLNHNGAKLTEQNFKDAVGRRWAWKMGKLARAVGFVVGEWQEKAVQIELERHNYEVRLAWLADGRDPKREYWWHVTELTLDHFRPSPKWIQDGIDLAEAKKQDAIEARGLKDLAERLRQQEDKMRMLREVIAEWQQKGEIGRV